MTSFLGVEHWSPLWVLVLGLISLAAHAGFGLLLLGIARLDYPSPWRQVLGTLLGILTFSLVIQVLAVSGTASRGELIAAWIAEVTLAGIGLAHEARIVGASWLRGMRSVAPALMIVVLANLSNLLVAVAPSTKIDELNYHMLLPGRLVENERLQFYRYPLEAAILPHMIFQIAAAPLHALGFPDAPNVISWGLSLLLQWFVWRQILQRTDDRRVAMLAVAVIAVGAFPVVWYVTGGAHALGDLASAAAVVAILSFGQLLAQLGTRRFAILGSILALASLSTKLTLLPFAGTVFLLTGYYSISGSGDARERLRSLFVLLTPWVILLAPLVLWTWLHSGSPFGPAFAGWFGASIYDVAEIRERLRAMREVNQPSLGTLVEQLSVEHAPLFWAGIPALFLPGLPRSIRLLGVFLLLVQLFVVTVLVQFDVRFLAGVPVGLLVVRLKYGSDRLRVALRSRWVVRLVCVSLLPWLAVQIVYSWPFARVDFGLESKERFLEHYTAFRADFRKLNELLPSKAVLLVPGFRLDAVYAPRPTYSDPADLPADRPIFWFEVGNRNPAIPHGFQKTDPVYENETAVAWTFRRPGRSPVVLPLRVSPLKPVP